MNKLTMERNTVNTRVFHKVPWPHRDPLKPSTLIVETGLFREALKPNRPLTEPSSLVCTGEWKWS